MSIIHTHSLSDPLSGEQSWRLSVTLKWVREMWGMQIDLAYVSLAFPLWDDEVSGVPCLVAYERETTHERLRVCLPIYYRAYRKAFDVNIWERKPHDELISIVRMDGCCNYVLLQTQFWLISVLNLLHKTFVPQLCKIQKWKNGLFSIHECEFELNWQLCTGRLIHIVIGLTRRIY